MPKLKGYHHLPFQDSMINNLSTTITWVLSFRTFLHLKKNRKLKAIHQINDIFKWLEQGDFQVLR